VPLLRQCGTSKLLRQCGTGKLLRACPPPPSTFACDYDSLAATISNIVPNLSGCGGYFLKNVSLHSMPVSIPKINSAALDRCSPNVVSTKCEFMGAVGTVEIWSVDPEAYVLTTEIFLSVVNWCDQEHSITGDYGVSLHLGRVDGGVWHAPFTELDRQCGSNSMLYVGDVNDHNVWAAFCPGDNQNNPFWVCFSDVSRSLIIPSTHSTGELTFVGYGAIKCNCYISDYPVITLEAP